MFIIFRSSAIVTLLCFICSAAIFFGCDRSINIIDAADPLPPAVPQSVTITWAYDGSIDIDWVPNDAINIKGYHIYRSINDTLNLKLLAFTSSSYFTNDSLSYDSTYYYRISSVSTQNLESRKSAWIKGKPVNRYYPNRPQYLEINARNWNDSLSIFIKWRPNLEGDIAGYKIYRSENSQFNADTNSFAGFTSTYYFSDRKNLQLYKTYYYIVKAVDKGGLHSTSSTYVSDILFEKPSAVSPANNGIVDFFREFRIKAVSFPASYRIVLQSNQYFGEIWSKDFSTDVVNDTVSVGFDSPNISSGVTYYWRIVTFSNGNAEPNSISNLFNFTTKP